MGNRDKSFSQVLENYTKSALVTNISCCSLLIILRSSLNVSCIKLHLQKYFKTLNFHVLVHVL